MEFDQLTNAAIAALERRSLIKKAGTSVASIAALAALAGGGLSATPAEAATTAQTPTAPPTALDINILNFALNLEYLEATYYLNALVANGIGLTGTTTGTTPTAIPGAAQVSPVTPTGQTLVPFTTSIVRQFAQTIAADEQAHVIFLRNALGSSAVPIPLIDVSASGAFTTLAVAAGYVPAGTLFNPYRDENSFLLGAYIFEDVGVTAYGGAAALLSQASTLVQYAASILAIEAYHAGTIRTLLAIRGGGAATDGVSNLRSILSSGAGEGTPTGDDFGTLDPVSGNVVLAPRDANALTYRRSTRQVLNIVYGNPGTPTAATPGLFFPNGLSVLPSAAGQGFN